METAIASNKETVGETLHLSTLLNQTPPHSAILCWKSIPTKKRRRKKYIGIYRQIKKPYCLPSLGVANESENLPRAFPFMKFF